MNIKTLNALILAAGVLAAAIPAAHADNANEAAEQKAVATAKLSAEEAARAAVGTMGGTVSSVQFYEESGKPAYHVEVVGKDGLQHDLSVDATTGVVVKMAATQDDDQDGDQNEGADGAQE